MPRDRAQLGHTRDERRPEKGRFGGAARRVASRRDARRRYLSQSALRRTGEDHEGRGSAAAAASRRRASRRDATRRRGTLRPSVESFSPRPYVDRNTRSPTSLLPGVVRAAPFSSGTLSLNHVLHEGTILLVLPRRIIESLFALLLPPSSFHPHHVSRPTRASYPSPRQPLCSSTFERCFAILSEIDGGRGCPERAGGGLRTPEIRDVISGGPSYTYGVCALVGFPAFEVGAASI